MNNLLSYCGLVDAKIRASDIDLPVCTMKRFLNYIHNREKLDSPKASSDTRHGKGNKMVQISICRGGQFQGTETNVIESFVVNAESFVSVFYQLVNGECSIIRLDHGVTDLF